MKTLRDLIVVASVLTVALSGTVARAGDTNSLPVASLEKLVSEQVNLRSQIAAEKRTWRDQERAWRAEIELLGVEEKALQKEVDESREFETSIQETRAGLVAQQEKLKRAQTDLLPHVERAEAELRAWQKAIPAPLMPPLSRAFAELPANRDGAARMGLSHRLQRVVALFTQIETLQHGLHPARELLAIDGHTRREMDVVYIGLARAFAVSADNLHAAVGSPSPDGWTWVPRNELAPDIRKAIAVLNKAITGELVTLPLQPSHNEDAKPGK